MSTTLLQGDCLDLLPTLAAGSVDLICADLPYGTTACKWDSVIPLDRLWPEYRRVLKPRGAVVLTASQPFSSTLVTSNLRWFRHEWIWRKARPTGFQFAKYAPMRAHELVLVFSPKPPIYNPQMVPKPSPIIKRYPTVKSLSSNMTSAAVADGYWTHSYPTTILPFAQDRGLHPTQKPVALMEYLIRTYSNPGDLVLDNTFGSCTTGVACINTGRGFIGMERDPGYFTVGQQRIAAAQAAYQPPLLEATA